LLGNFACGLGRLFGQRLDFPRDDGKATASLSGPRGLNGGVQGEQVGLSCDASSARRTSRDWVCLNLRRCTALLHRERKAGAQNSQSPNTCRGSGGYTPTW
jgi:hypothetical protein